MNYKHMNENKLNPLTPHSFGRHGEILIIRTDKLPENANLIEEGQSIIVGHSESGHHHVLDIDRKQGVTIKMYEVNGKTYLDIPLMATLSHQKTFEPHKTQIFTPGIYIREIRESYSYSERAMKRVSD